MRGSPGQAAVKRIGSADMADVLGGARIQAKVLVFDGNNDRLNDSMTASVEAVGGRRRHGNGTLLGPGLAIVGAALDPTGPTVVALDRSSAEYHAIGQDQRLLTNGPVEAGWKMFHRRPSLPFVAAETPCGAPLSGVGAEFIVEPKHAIGRVEKHRVVRGDLGLTSQFDGLLPATMLAARRPDGHVGLAFVGPAKPGGEQASVLQFDDSGGMAGPSGRRICHIFTRRLGATTKTSGRQQQQPRADLTH